MITGRKEGDVRLGVGDGSKPEITDPPGYLANIEKNLSGIGYDLLIINGD